MRSAALLTFILSASAYPSDLAPFSPAFLSDADISYINDTLSAPDYDSHDLLKRQNNCPANTGSCSTLAANAAGACCNSGSICSFDNVGNVACCPLGSLCTGTIVLPSRSSSGAVFVNTNTEPTTTTSNGIIMIIPASTPASIPASTTPSASVTFVPNTFFPYPVIPTTYLNSAACASAYQACTANYALCTADLQGGGGGFPVTIDAPGGGVTVGPAAGNLGAASATSICNSLSSKACPGNPGTCGNFGTATATGFTLATASGVERVVSRGLETVVLVVLSAIWWNS